MEIKIKSLDELKEGDVVEVKHSPNNLSIYAVRAIGEVPEHEREILLSRLYSPEKKDSEIEFRGLTIRESDLTNLNITKHEREEYKGWRYLSVKIL